MGEKSETVCNRCLGEGWYVEEGPDGKIVECNGCLRISENEAFVNLPKLPPVDRYGAHPDGNYSADSMRRFAAQAAEEAWADARESYRRLLQACNETAEETERANAAEAALLPMRATLEAIAKKDFRRVGYSATDMDWVPACSSREAQRLAETALANVRAVSLTEKVS